MVAFFVIKWDLLPVSVKSDRNAIIIRIDMGLYFRHKGALNDHTEWKLSNYPKTKLDFFQSKETRTPLDNQKHAEVDPSATIIFLVVG